MGRKSKRPKVLTQAQWDAMQGKVRSKKKDIPIETKPLGHNQEEQKPRI